MKSGGTELTVEERINFEVGIRRRIEEMGLENFFDPRKVSWRECLECSIETVLPNVRGVM